jgi:hypothetical protein
MRLRLALLSLLLAQSATAFGQRVELPIREVDLSDGMRRYAVTLDIDGRPIEAALDTGSSGLRVLAPRLSDSAQAAKGHSSSYGYESGAEFKGQDIKLPIAMGAISANAELMRVDAIGCRREKPNCPMGGADLKNFGIMGDMLPGQGFAAIIGTAVNSNDIGNPLVELGVKRWIVDLPRQPGETGKLILNPDDADVATFKRFAIDDRGMFSGCLIAAAKPSQRICAPAIFDSGAPGIHIIGGESPRSQQWPRGTDVLLALGDQHSAASIGVTLGRREQAAGFFIEPGPPKQHLAFGIAPYLAWSVLYDASRHEIGVAPR